MPAESVSAFLLRLADFLEAHGRDEGGFAPTMRAAFADDARRLRELARQRYASRAKRSADSPYHRGDRVVVTLPGCPPFEGEVVSNSFRADRVCVRRDGQRTAGIYHQKFVIHSDQPASEAP